MPTLLAILLLSAAASVELRTLDGRKISGELETCDVAAVRIKTADGSVDVPVDQVWEVVPSEAPVVRRPPAEAIVVHLTDGSTIIAEKFAVKDGEATVKLAEDRSIFAPTTGVAHVRFAVPTELEAQWQEVLNSKVAGDLVVIKKDGALDYLEGVLGDTDPDGGFAFTLDGDVLPVKRARVAGILYFHKTSDPLPTAAALVTDVQGSHFAAVELKLDDETLSGKSPAGAAWSVSLDQLAKIDFSQGRVTYLSDLAAVRDTWTPYLGAAKLPTSVQAYYASKRNRAIEAQDLQVAGERYAQGLSLHSRSEVAYRLDGQFRRFQALAGIDDRTAGLGAVRLVIRGDDRVLWEGQVTAKNPPEMLNLSTENVRVLSILVDYGDGHETADHLDLCDAKVIR